MGTHIPALAPASDSKRLRAKAEPLRSTLRAAAAPSARASDQPLTPDEAELAQRLTAALEYAPNRKAPDSRGPSQPTIASIIDAPPLFDIDDVTTHAPSAALLTLAEDAAGSDDAALRQTPAWLRRTPRKSWRERLSAFSAWTLTLGVIVGIVGGITVAALGLDRAVGLVAIATDEVATLASAIAGHWQKFLP